MLCLEREIKMDDDGTHGIQNWREYSRTPPPLLKGNLGLQLMSTAGERDSMPFFSGGGSCCGANGGYFHRECVVTEPSAVLMDFTRDVWYHKNRDSCKMHHVFHGKHHHHSHSYGLLLPEATAAAAATEETGTHTTQMLQRVGASGEERVPVIEDDGAPQHVVMTLKKKSKDQGRASKASKPKKTKKSMPPKEASASPSERGRSETKSMDMVVNGIDIDLSGMPTPVCACTGQPQPCYRWGAGGWQSACCTTSISIYPLPLSTKKRGARIAGRKMSQGAFKMVLQKLQVEGQDFSSPIDLKPFWAKHGINKLVTIR